MSTQHGSTAPCLWLHCSYMGVGGFPGAWESNRWEEKAPFLSQRAQSLLPAQGCACLAGWVQRHMNVLGCLQLVLGSVTALETEGQRAPACLKVCSLGTETFSSPAGLAKSTEGTATFSLPWLESGANTAFALLMPVLIPSPSSGAKAVPAPALQDKGITASLPHHSSWHQKHFLCSCRQCLELTRSTGCREAVSHPCLCSLLCTH